MRKGGENMQDFMQKKIVLIILVLLFIMTISGTVAAAGSDSTNTVCNKDIKNYLKCNHIAQNNYCNTCTLPSSQFSCTIPKYICNATTEALNICCLNPHESAIIENPNICTMNCLNTINCGNDPPICVIPSIPNICDPGQTNNGQSSDPGDISNATGEIKNNSGTADDKTKVNATTIPLQGTGLPIIFLVTAILVIFTGLLPKMK